MKFKCYICKYTATTKANLNRHYKTLKHKNNLKLHEESNSKICSECGSYFKHASNYYRHIKVCNEDKSPPERPKIIKEESYIPTINLGEAIQGNGQQIVANVINIVNSNINSNNVNNVNNTMAKIDNLNNLYNIHNMIDMDTFIRNYKSNPNYQLTEQESYDVLETYLEIGHKNLGYKLSHYLKDKCRQQLKDKTDLSIQLENTVLPLLSSDCSTRTHFERQINSWRLVTDISNIKKLIVITSDQVYQHHNKYINLSGSEMKTVANTILKDNQYTKAIANSHSYKPITSSDNTMDKKMIV